MLCKQNLVALLGLPLLGRPVGLGASFCCSFGFGVPRGRSLSLLRGLWLRSFLFSGSCLRLRLGRSLQRPAGEWVGKGHVLNSTIPRRLALLIALLIATSDFVICRNRDRKDFFWASLHARMSTCALSRKSYMPMVANKARLEP